MAQHRMANSMACGTIEMAMAHLGLPIAVLPKDLSAFASLTAKPRMKNIIGIAIGIARMVICLSS